MWLSIVSSLGPRSSGAIRLVRDGTTSPDYTSGVVQVWWDNGQWWNGQWVNICNDASFGYDEADVVCHQLGWSGASYYTSSQYDRFVVVYFHLNTFYLKISVIAMIMLLHLCVLYLVPIQNISIYFSVVIALHHHTYVMVILMYLLLAVS